jgi:NAD-dependent deacetylase
MPDRTADLARAREWVREATAVTVLTGAGISTDSGIPDFRGPQGIWTKDPQAQALFTLSNYVADPAVRVRAWRGRRDHPAWTAQPNAAHEALVQLERSGRLRALVTQNIDELHQRAGSSAELVAELHGTVWQAECLSCGDQQPMAAVIARVDAGEEDPPCLHCGGIVKSATISFGQSLDPAVLVAAVHAARDCDLFLAVGTSLAVHPAAGLCDLAQAHGARLVIVNAEPTPYDDQADAVLRDPIGAVLPALVDGLVPAG